MGCFAKGCLTILILGFLCIAAVVGSCWYVYHKLATNNLISDAPAAVQLEQPSEPQYRAAEDSLARVKSANTSSREATVAFTAADLNALLAKDPDFRDLALPTRLIWAEHDPFFPLATAERLRSAIPGAESRVHVIAGASHFPQEDRPGEVARLIAEFVR